MNSGMMGALNVFDATEANLIKLERLSDKLESLMPNSIEFGGNAAYEETAQAIEDIYAALPKIDDWKPAIDILDWNDIAQWRLDAHEIGEIDVSVALDKALAAPSRVIRQYRHRFNKLRRALVRDAMGELVQAIDGDITSVRSVTSTDSPIADKMSGPEWELLLEHIDQLSVLLGSSSLRPKRWKDIVRHAGFGFVQDFNDIEVLDWPSIRKELGTSSYDANEAIPVSVDDLGTVVAAKPHGSVTTRLGWSVLKPEDFEALIFRLISTQPNYENPQWLMKTNAPDKGRDLSVFRIDRDPLLGTIRKRVIIQCRHQQQSLNLPDIAAVKEQMSLWKDPPVDELVFATTTRFTSDAVEYIENFNAGSQALKIHPWPENQIERFLAARPELKAEFGLQAPS